MEPEKKSNGAFVGLVIIILILVVGGVYMWLANDQRDDLQETQLQEQNERLSEQDANDLDTLEQDANGVDASTGVDVNVVN